MQRIPHHLKLRLPFLVAGFVSLALSVWLYFVQDDTTAAIFVGLWVPSIHSLGSLMLTPVDEGVRDDGPAPRRTEVSS